MDPQYFSSRDRNRSISPGRITGLRLLTLGLAVVVLLLVAASCGRVQEADTEYEDAMAQIDEIEALLDEKKFYHLTPDEMSWLESEFVTLERRLENLQDLSTLPLGLDDILANEDVGSSRYRAVKDTLEVARLLAESGEVVASVGEETLIAFEETGIRANPANNDETWLDVLERREDEVNSALETIEDALALREEIDEDDLPGRFHSHLERIDAMTERISTQRELANELPLAFQTLGADGPVRYLALLQNPAEMRPTGGFIGTAATFEIEGGQVASHEFHNMYDFSRRYQENLDEPVSPPWAVEEYIRPDHLQFQDANWWADFPETAGLMREFARIAGYPEYDAVVAVQPEAVADLLSITGPIPIEVDGEEREITHDNLHDETERQRRIAREGGEPETGHKEVVALIGEVMLDHLAEQGRAELIDAAFLMFDALDRRDMQGYHPDEDVQAFLEERNWAGRLHPDPEAATIAPVLANVTGLKTSLAMQPSLDLQLSEPDSSGMVDATMTLSLAHLGDEAEDPFYEGFQRWWLDITLPDGTEVRDSSRSPAEDPDASNGGAYIVDLDVGEQQELTLEFRMPEHDRLLLRRQPGLLIMDMTISADGCDGPLEAELDRDLVIQMEGTCPVVEADEDDGEDSGDDVAREDS